MSHPVFLTKANCFLLKSLKSQESCSFYCMSFLHLANLTSNFSLFFGQPWRFLVPHLKKSTKLPLSAHRQGMSRFTIHKNMVIQPTNPPCLNPARLSFIPAWVKLHPSSRRGAPQRGHPTRLPYVSHSSTPRPPRPVAGDSKRGQREGSGFFGWQQPVEHWNVFGKNSTLYWRFGKKKIGRFGLFVESLESICRNANGKRQTDVP